MSSTRVSAFVAALMALAFDRILSGTLGYSVLRTLAAALLGTATAWAVAAVSDRLSERRNRRRQIGRR